MIFCSKNALSLALATITPFLFAINPNTKLSRSGGGIMSFKTFAVASGSGTPTSSGTPCSSGSALSVSGITVSGTPEASATSVDFTVTFNESVTGVDVSDFALDATGTVTASISSVSGSDAVYIVTVNTIAGEGTLSIDVNSSGTGIKTTDNCLSLSGGYTAGTTHTVTPAEETVAVPEIFSPDGNGTNDKLIISGIDEFPNNTVIIFNRLGQKVFEASPYNTENAWDGTINTAIGSDKAPTGTYFYLLDKGNGSDYVKKFIYLQR